MLERTSFSWRPALVPMIRPRVLAQTASPKTPIPVPVLAIGHTVAFGVGAATAWVGFDTGARRTGLLSVLGYVIGVGGALSAVVDLVILGGLGYRAVTGRPPASAATNAPLM